MQSPHLKAKTLIVGGGLVGSSVAMHLSALGEKDIAVIDFDLSGRFSSSELNAGGVRATFSQPLNILAAKASIEEYERLGAQVGYLPVGYLWLHSGERAKAAKITQTLQNDLGWEVRTLSHSDLKQKVPLLDKQEGIEYATFSPRDGLINPNRLKMHYREEAIRSGVSFHDRLRCVSCDFAGGGKITLACDLYPRAMEEAQKEKVLLTLNHNALASRVELHCERLVLCSGAWAKQLSQAFSFPCPSRPVRRQISLFDARGVDLAPLGMIVDTSGVYFHPESTHLLGGYADPEEQEGINFDYDGESFFQEKIWSALFERSTQFENLKHLTGWAGLYGVTPDDMPILGRMESFPSHEVFEAHSFSGRGTMLSYAAGRGLAELMAKGRFETLDLSGLSVARFSSSGDTGLGENLVI